MQLLVIDFTLIAVFAAVVGLMSSVGMSGGAYRTPLLIIVFGLGAEMAAATSLFSALFVAIVSTAAFARYKPNPIITRLGLLFALVTVPCSLLGIMVRTSIGDDFILRLIFGVLLFPAAIMMLFTERTDREDHAFQITAYEIYQCSRVRQGLAFLGILAGGLASGLLGVGGGVIIVPVLCLLLEMPILVAAATSMFTMIFTTSAGTIMNFVMLPNYGDFSTFMFFGLAMGIGMVVGGQIGPRYACRIDAVHLKRVFGVLLVFPLVKMMGLGRLWLDPLGLNFHMEIIGDFIICLLIILPIVFFRWYQIRRQSNP
ncbi:MAG: sulfite exporter TauE/SafE family protein [Candidatus Thorarchaeota archaeon]